MKDKSANVYIILLNYNNWKDTVECIESLQVIRNLKFHIIVVDNKSTDNSIVEFNKRLPASIKLIEAQENKGFSAGNNIGIRYAIQNNADYILLLNNDTLADMDFLTPLISFAQDTPNLGCISSRIYYNDNRNQIWYDGGDFNAYICRAIHRRYNSIGSSITGIQVAGFVTGCCMLIPRDVIKQVGYLDENYFLYVEDTEYSLRLRKHGFELYWNADCYIYHKVSASTNKISRLTNYYEIRNRLLLKQTYLNWLQKIVTGLYNVPFYSYKLLSKKYDIVTFRKAISDHRNNNYGRYNDNLNKWDISK